MPWHNSYRVYLQINSDLVTVSLQDRALLTHLPILLDCGLCRQFPTDTLPCIKACLGPTLCEKPADCLLNRLGPCAQNSAHSLTALPDTSLLTGSLIGPADCPVRALPFCLLNSAPFPDTVASSVSSTATSMCTTPLPPSLAASRALPCGGPLPLLELADAAGRPAHPTAPCCFLSSYQSLVCLMQKGHSLLPQVDLCPGYF